MARLLLALVLVPTAFVACGDKEGTDPDAYPEANCNDAIDNDEDGVTDCDDDDCAEAPACDGSAPDPETLCDDGTDDDGDGAIDCDDSDCATSFAPCTWPKAMDMSARFNFDGQTAVCETFFGDFEEEIADCVTNLASSLTAAADLQGCTACERVFSGSVTTLADSCTDQFGEGGSPAPTSFTFGFVFTSEVSRELWVKDDSTGAWTKAVDLTLSGTVWSYTTSDRVEVPVDECDNSPIDVGLLTATFDFTDK
ncbi:hypothetical protein L6R49_25675 [Myxococcota bacterium]|nr:hypothetical protein [Myxococcota bacterium]